MNDPFSSPALVEEKRAVRRTMRWQLATFDEEEREEASRKIVARLVTLPVWRDARCVGLFAPMVTEPDLDILWRGAHLTGKVCAYPAVTGGEVRFYRVESLEGLRPVPPWNLREPPPGPAAECPLGGMDLLLVPGLAFGPGGGRLGRGGGYYDRLLERRPPARPVAVGVGFAFQRLDSLPLAPHDVRLDELLCE